jgi:hypothetical protein
MGMMNREVAEIIGNEVGELMDVDVEENGMTVGQYLRVKVRIDIRRPLMRGVTMKMEEDVSSERWCPFTYEFLPEFCHNCGIIGHTDRSCTVSNPAGRKQYGSWLCVLPPRCRFSSQLISDGPSSHKVMQTQLDRTCGDWRKNKMENMAAKENSIEEAISQLMIVQNEDLNDQGNHIELKNKSVAKDAVCTDPVRMEQTTGDHELGTLVGDVHATMETHHIVHGTMTPTSEKGASSGANQGRKKVGTFKRFQRNVKQSPASKTKESEGKRSVVTVLEEEQIAKKPKNNIEAPTEEVQMMEYGEEIVVKESATNPMVKLSEQPNKTQ